MVKILLAFGLILAMLVIMPIATIWSLNTLFPALAIPLSFDTWIATVVLGGVVGGTTGVSFKK
jgi:hypothetical protein